MSTRNEPIVESSTPRMKRAATDIVCSPTKKNNSVGKETPHGTITKAGAGPGKATITNAAGLNRRRYHVRKSILQSIFFPQYLHKDHLAEGAHADAQAALEAGESADHLNDLTCREKVVHLIHTKTVQCIFLILLVLDVLIVCAEIIILSHKTCHLHVHGHDHHVHCDHHNMTESADGTIYLDHGCGLQISLELPHALHTAEVVLGWISFAILAIFAIELITLFVCLCHKFFTVMYCLDVVVIFGSIIIFFTVHGEDQAASGLIIFVRMWRFARILHGFGLTVHDYDTEIAEHEHEEHEHGEHGHGHGEHEENRGSEMSGTPVNLSGSATVVVEDGEIVAVVDDDVKDESEKKDETGEKNEEENGQA